jgi:HAD superfamily hydrolase (TIGR01490 family)
LRWRDITPDRQSLLNTGGEFGLVVKKRKGKSSMKKTGAFFDFDKTLLMVESAKPGLKYLYKRKEVSSAYLLLVIIANFFYKYHLFSDEKMANLLLRLYQGKCLSDFQAGAAQFYIDHIRPLLAPNILSRLNVHKEKGHSLILVSASVRYYLEEVVQDLGFDHLLCTDLEESPDGLLTGRAKGPVCIDLQKKIQSEQLAKEQGIDLEASYAYGNHHSDIPLLEIVGHPFAVEPTRPLKKTAIKNNWPILRFI